MIKPSTLTLNAALPTPAEPDQQPRLEPRRVLTSQALLRGQKAVQIAHNGCLYRLQATKLGKLILTK
jgi:hemin uptake protein HemP